MSTRANLLKCRGLITNENELSVEPGSLRQATNVNIDEEGVITPRRGFKEYGDPTNDALSQVDLIKQIMEYKNRIFRHYSDKLEFEDENGTFNSVVGEFNEVLSGYRLKFQEASGNLFFTSSDGIRKISLKRSSQITSSTNIEVTQAGVPRAAYLEGEIVDDVGGFLPAQSKVAYRFIFGTRDNAGNLLLGSPSMRFVLENTNDSTQTAEQFTIRIDDFNLINNDDYIIVPTLNRKVTFYFDVNGSNDNPPIDSQTIGSDFLEVDISNVSNNNDAAAILANTTFNGLSEYDVTISGNEVTFTSTEQGDIDDRTLSGNGFSEINLVQGSFQEGSAANANIDLIIPDTVDTSFFVQVFRTNFITANNGLDLQDVDPGDEMNLIYEEGLDQGQIDAGILSFLDNIPESFRANNVPLYTNEITGQGILQANDRPPIALDIDLFRGSMFYANTKSRHRLEFTILSVDDFVRESTTIAVGDSTVSRFYTASTTETADTEEGGDFFASQLASVGQAIDETARSLVKIINQDTDSVVNAFYISGVDDLPGKILLESRSISDDPFYVSILEDSNPNIGGEFNPEFPIYKEIESFTGQGDTTEITITSHGFSNGDSVYVSYNKDQNFPSDPDGFSGIYEISNVTTDTFEIQQPNSTSVVNFVPRITSIVVEPEVESDNLEAANRLYYSKIDQPEAVPQINFINIGAKDQPIRRILALRDNLFVLKDDGVFIVSGTSAPNFSARLTDSTRIIAPDSSVVLNNQIYCLTEQGICRINASGQVGIISRGIENLIDEVANANFDFSPNTFGISYENDRAYVLFLPQSPEDTSATQAYRYNIFERTWSRWSYNATCGLVLNRDSKLYLGSGDRNFVTQERKNFDRTDHADREFETIVVLNGVENEVIEVGNIQDIEVGDAVTQTQDVTIYYLNNRILRRMDEFDNRITPPTGSTMLQSFGVQVGEDIAIKVNDLNTYLRSLDAQITDKTINDSNLLEQINLLIDELNSATTISNIKNYAKPETVTFESFVVGLDRPRNRVTLNSNRPLLEGNITIYKNIEKDLEWNPQHAGDPSALKQFREMTLIFDQNDFYDARLSFASDVSQDFSPIDFRGKGIGYWGDLPWGDPNHYWGGEGNDIPFRTIVPRGKQRCRYLSILFEHKNAREDFRILGISYVVRAISSRAYK